MFLNAPLLIFRVEISALMRKRTHKGTTIEEKIKKIRTGKNFQPDLEVDHENSDSGVSDDSVRIFFCFFSVLKDFL